MKGILLCQWEGSRMSRQGKKIKRGKVGTGVWRKDRKGMRYAGVTKLIVFESIKG